MSITQTHIFSPAIGEEGFVSFPAWIATLPADQLAAATAGLAAQVAVIDKHLASGKIVSQDGGHIIWAADSDAERFEVDPVFKAYFDRYTTESGTTHTLTVS